MTDKCLRCGHVMDFYEKDADYCLPCLDTLTKALGRKPTREDYLKPLTADMLRSCSYDDDYFKGIQLMMVKSQSGEWVHISDIMGALDGLKAELGAELDREWINNKIDKWFEAFKYGKEATDKRDK